MTHTEETLELDDKGYPRLPEDVLSLRLSRKKAITRQFVAAARRMYHSGILKRHHIHYP
jgi:hypothetical protein